ncbi:hypothetical protein MLD38_018521 [Melastoma candidum]|uniref:Uncharacterized protein n=1 Tax=Melastoma candidum TaxID=119954 RepID=A0ACB9QY45_9MYRT|nr:hypothetical protein MLD38_018521 [Melastoma candidum]
MASKREAFHLAGPLHLTFIDWENANYRSSVAACLVRGVYILERDRQEQRLGPEALAPPWWEFFHFRLLRCLIDSDDSSIFGAIYEYRPPSSQKGHSAYRPHIVVAFRGTLTKKESFWQDLKLDLLLIRHGLHRTSRFKTAMQTVHDMVADAGDSRVWLAGHSLGSAIAMLAGKNMARSGKCLLTFLFNPPYFSAPIKPIKSPKLKHGLRFAKTAVTAGLAKALKTSEHGHQLTRAEEEFLSAWLPNLFVNPEDRICSEYKGYFEHRKMMVEMGAGAIERLVAQQSIGSLVMTAMGKETEAVKFVPSANLVVNTTPCPDFKTAHALHQWWQPEAQLQAKIYQYS